MRNAEILNTLLYKINLKHIPEVEFYLEELMNCDSDILNPTLVIVFLILLGLQHYKIAIFISYDINDVGEI